MSAAINDSGIIQSCDNVPVGFETCDYQWAMAIELSIGLCTILLNVIHIHILRTNFVIKRRAVTRVMLHLAACDLIYGVFLVTVTNCPMQRIMRQLDYLPLCAASFALAVGMVAVSAAFLTAMSLERCIVICRPFNERHSIVGTMKRIHIAIWVISLAYTVGTTWYYMYEQSNHRIVVYCFYGVTGCGVRWTDGGFVMGLVLAGTNIFFLVTMLVANAIIGVKIQYAKRFRIEAMINMNSVRTAKLIGLMCLAFALCFSVILLWLTMRVAAPHLVQLWHGHASYMILSCNSAMNPLIYGLTCSDYRSSLRNMIPNLFDKHRVKLRRRSNNYSDKSISMACSRTTVISDTELPHMKVYATSNIN